MARGAGNLATSEPDWSTAPSEPAGAWKLRIRESGMQIRWRFSLSSPLVEVQKKSRFRRRRRFAHLLYLLGDEHQAEADAVERRFAGRENQQHREHRREHH